MFKQLISRNELCKSHLPEFWPLRMFLDRDYGKTPGVNTGGDTTPEAEMRAQRAAFGGSPVAP